MLYYKEGCYALLQEGLEGRVGDREPFPRLYALAGLGVEGTGGGGGRETGCQGRGGWEGRDEIDAWVGCGRESVLGLEPGVSLWRSIGFLAEIRGRKSLRSYDSTKLYNVVEVATTKVRKFSISRLCSSKTRV